MAFPTLSRSDSGVTVVSYKGPATPPLVNFEDANVRKEIAGALPKDGPVCCRAKERLCHGGPKALEASKQAAAAEVFSLVDAMEPWSRTMESVGSTRFSSGSDNSIASAQESLPGPASSDPSQSSEGEKYTGDEVHLSVVRPEVLLAFSDGGEEAPGAGEERVLLRQWCLITLPDGAATSVSRVVARQGVATAARWPQDLPRRVLSEVSTRPVGGLASHGASSDPGLASASEGPRWEEEVASHGSTSDPELASVSESPNELPWERCDTETAFIPLGLCCWKLV